MAIRRERAGELARLEAERGAIRWPRGREYTHAVVRREGGRLVPLAFAEAKRARSIAEVLGAEVIPRHPPRGGA